MINKKGLVAEAMKRQGIDPSSVKPNNAELHALCGRRFESDMRTDKKTPEELAEEYSKKVQDDQADSEIDVVTWDRITTWERRAWLAGYETGRPKWVSVEDKYPPKHQLVLCVFSGIVSYGKWSGRVWVVNDEPEASLVKTDIISFVTHWQPLPEPPKDL